LAVIIDAHTHVFPEGVREDPEAWGRRDPVFRLVYVEGKARMAGAGDTLEAMDEAGVDRAVLCSFPWRDPDPARESNEYILECIERWPDRFVGFCCVNPAWGAAALREAGRCLERGMRGIGELHPEPQGFHPGDSDLLRPLVDLAREADVPLMLHVNEPVGHVYVGKGGITPRAVYPLVKAFPEVDWILSHWGGGLLFYELMPEVAEACRRVHYDSAASPFLYRPEIYAFAARLAGPHRLLFGTDFPLVGYRRALKNFEGAGLEEEAAREVLGGNAARLLRLRGVREGSPGGGKEN